MATLSDANGHGTARDSSDSEREAKRIKTGEEPNPTITDGDGERESAESGTSAASASAADPYPGYDLDPSGSGWYINRQAPSWQYSPSSNLYYDAQANTFYRMDPTTKEYTVVDYNAAMAQNGSSEKTDVVDVGLGKGPLLPHVADYTFMQGRRPTQEDRHTMIPDFGRYLKGMDVSAAFYAVFDGHSGDQCSDFVAKNLHLNLARQLKKNVGKALTETVVKDAITAAAAATDKEFLRIAKIRKRQDGCCCIAVLLLDSTMFVINIGDSRAVIARKDNVAEAMSDDHKPERPDEQKRIEDAGGHVLKYGDCYRVTSMDAIMWEKQKIKQGPRPVQPAVARSFGDISLKLPPMLISVPEISVFKLLQTDSLVLLGCDGIWDVLTNQLAVDTAIKAGKDGADPKGIAGSVVDLSFKLGSTDNISVVAILLHASAS
eukprot:m.181999 g.181999  ORF g.181999 m.181999 type:complete len:433 (+) comp18452_c0_seq5:137-1435(+)